MAEVDKSDVAICSKEIVLIVTTSPVPSMPSTQLISDLLKSLPDALKMCDIVFTFDGFKPCQESSEELGRAKRGKIPQRLAAQYPTYVSNVKALFAGAIHPVDHVGWGEEQVSMVESAHQVVTFVEQPLHTGFALSVKAALKYTSRRFVMVLQHDWVFTAAIPATTLLHIMGQEQHVKYITFMSRNSTRYEETRTKSHHRFKAVHEATKAMRKDKPLAGNLVSCFHFLDRPHLMKTEDYRDVFARHSVLTMEPFIFRRGDFIEDTLGARYAQSIKSASSDESALQAWQQLGAWMFALDSGERVVKHSHGRAILAREEQEARVAGYIQHKTLPAGII